MIVIVIVIVVVIVILILVLILIVARRGRNENAEYRHAVGVVNFFNATIAPDPPAARKSDRFVSFDITKLARKLCASGRLKDRAVVTLVPAGVPAADARPIMGAVTLVEQ